MTPNVVVAVADLEDVARLASVQRAFGETPVHVWAPGRRSTPVHGRDKRRLHALLLAGEERWGPAPLLLPAREMRREAPTLERVVARLLRDVPARRYLGCRRGSFAGHPVEVVRPDVTAPFPSVWFLVAGGRAHEGEGTFERLTRGRVVARYGPLLLPRPTVVGAPTRSSAPSSRTRPERPRVDPARRAV